MPPISFPNQILSDSNRASYGYNDQMAPETALEQQALNRKQQIANLLLMQGLSPQSAGQMVGRFFVPNSPVQGLASLAQAGLGAYGMHKGDQARQELAAKDKNLITEAIAKHQQATQPTISEGPRPTVTQTPEAPMHGLAPAPPQAPVTSELPGPGAPVSTPRSPEDVRKSIVENLMLSTHPQAQRVGQTLIGELDKKETRQDQQAFLKAQSDEAHRVRTADLKTQMAMMVANKLITQQQADAALAQNQKLHDERMAAEKERDRQNAVKIKGMDVAQKQDAIALKAGGKVEDQKKGRETVNGLVASLRDQYDQLQQAGGITDTEKGPLSNIMAGVASSGAGQATGSLLGTKNQSLRNTIAQQRPLLLQAIKSATGMSAKQMDSNVELKLYLSMATDPQLDIQTNRKALDMIEKLFGAETVAGPEATVEPPAVGAGQAPTATGPNGEKLILKDGQWQPLQ